MVLHPRLAKLLVLASAAVCLTACGLLWMGYDGLGFVLVALIAAIGPFRRLWRAGGDSTGPLAGFSGREDRIRDERYLHGQCLDCGYDVRGSPERCSECGSPIIGRSTKPPDHKDRATP